MLGDKVPHFINVLLNQGVAQADPSKAQYVRQANLNGLIFFVLDLVLAGAFFLALEDTYIPWGLLVTSLLFLTSTVGFNRIGWTTLSRMSTVSIGSFLVVYCALYLGPESFAAASLLLGAIFPFTFFSIDERKEILICILISVLCYAFLIVLDYELGPRLVVEHKSSLLVLKVIFFAVPFIGIVSNTYAAVTQIEKRARELAESRKQLETIFHALSHDLANPLLVVSATVDQAARQGALPTDKIQRLQRGTQQMSRIFVKLKKLALMSDSTARVNVEIHDVNTLVRDAVAFVEEQAEAKGIRLVVRSLPEAVPVAVDKDLFTFQAMVNFLTNAIKFSDSGGEVRISIEKTPKNKVKIVVKDSGMGIEPEHLAKLNAPGARVTTLGTRGEHGTGWGLSLARKFLADMKCVLDIKSIPKSTNSTDHGTEIHVDLPIVSETAAETRRVRIN